MKNNNAKVVEQLQDKNEKVLQVEEQIDKMGKQIDEWKQMVDEQKQVIDKQKQMIETERQLKNNMMAKVEQKDQQIQVLQKTNSELVTNDIQSINQLLKSQVIEN